MKTLSSPGLAPSTFLVLAIATHPFISKLAVLACVAPLAFIVMKIARVQLISTGAADMAVRTVSNVWPTLQVQYHFIRDVSPVDAANYVLFAACLSLLTILALIATVVFYIKTSSNSKAFIKIDVFLLGIFGAGAYFALYKDMPHITPTSVLDFRVDRLGLFVLRQWVLIAGIIVGLVLLTAAVMTAWSYVNSSLTRSRTE